MEQGLETGRAPNVDEGAGLAGEIALAGGSVARASAELRGVADVLAAAASRVKDAETRASELEARVDELSQRLVALGDVPPVTVIVDHERSALQDAIAAEIRRPLTSILGITLALKHHEPDSKDGLDMIKQLSANARKLDRLVTELLDLEKLLDGSLSPNRRRSDLAALVRRVADESPDLANRELLIQADRASVTVDPTLTEQIVESLLANAGRRTAPGQRVWVKVIGETNGATIAVEDTVEDVTDDMKTALAQPSPDAETRPRRPKVAGLSLLARLAAVQGGRAWVEERPEGGASFRVFLPDALDAADPASSEGGAAAPADGYRALEGPVAIDGGAIAI
jgi:signal transduction histidine kinase